MTKKLLIGLIAIIMCTSLVACSTKDSTENKNEEVYEETNYDEEYMDEEEIIPGEDYYDEYGDD